MLKIFLARIALVVICPLYILAGAFEGAAHGALAAIKEMREEW